MQRWWIAIVALIGVGLAFFLFPRPDRGAVVSSDTPSAEAATETEAPRGPTFGSRTKVERPPAAPAPVPPEVIEAQKRIAQMRAQPDAQASAKLIGAWSGVRKTLMESESEEAKALADRLRQPLQDLAEFRRNPKRGVPFDQIRASLDKLHTEISDSQFADEGFVPGGLAKHTEVLELFEAMEAGTGKEDSP